MSAVRFDPNVFSNCRCACTHPFIPARNRASPASVTRSSLLRRSRLPCSTAIRPSRSCENRKLRRAQPARRQKLIVELRDVPCGLTHREAVAVLRSRITAPRHRNAPS